MREYQKAVLKNPKNLPALNVNMLNMLVPLYVQGWEAGEKLLNETITDKHLMHRLSSLVELKELALSSIVHHGYPLMVKELQKLLNNSTLSMSPDIFQVLFFEGVNGLERGLLKYDPKKTLSVSYIMSWFTTYAERELLRLETPTGVSPTRYQVLKKIYAVRNKMEHELGRAPTHEEVVDYFHSGKADRASKRGRKTGTASQANQKITLEDVIEQHEVTLAMNLATRSYELIQPYDNTQQPANSTEGVVTSFLQQHVNNIKPDALTTLVYYLGYDVDTSLLTTRKMNALWSTWVKFFNTPGTVFRELLESNGITQPTKNNPADNNKAYVEFHQLFNNPTLILGDKA